MFVVNCLCSTCPVVCLLPCLAISISTSAFALLYLYSVVLIHTYCLTNKLANVSAFALPYQLCWITSQ
jgi:hypothetical protein